MQRDHQKGPWGLLVRRKPVTATTKVTTPENGAGSGAARGARLVPGSMQQTGRLKGTRDQLRPGYSALVDEFLTRTEQLPAAELARIVGVNPATIHRWRLMGVRKVTGVTLDRMMRYLAGQSG